MGNSLGRGKKKANIICHEAAVLHKRGGGKGGGKKVAESIPERKRGGKRLGSK